MTKPLKTVFAPHINRTVKFGRRAPKGKTKALPFKAYVVEKAMPPVPTTFDFTSAAMSSLRLIYGNDALGDCVIAGGYHVLGTETGNANGGQPFLATQDQIIADYSAIGGYVPGDSSTDQGCDEETALQYWTKQGFADGTKIIGYLSVDPTNWAEVKLACYLFENLFFGIALPDAWINPFPSGDGFTWDVAGDPDPENGHCVISPAKADDNGVTIATWAMLGQITKAAIAKYCASTNGGQLFVLLTAAQIAKGQAKAPNGFAWDDLIADWDAIGGNVPSPAPSPSPSPSPTPPAPTPVPPAPSPSPAPAPSSSGVTLAQAQAAVKAAFEKEKAVLSRTEASRAAKAALAKLTGWPT